MGDFSIIRQAASETRCTTGLGQSGKLGVQLCECTLQDFAVARVLSSFELLEHILAGQPQALLLALFGDLGGSQRWLGWDRSGNCLRLLLLDRLALPSSRHAIIVPVQLMADCPCCPDSGQLGGPAPNGLSNADFQQIG